MLKKYLSLVKFSHTIFALPFAIIGFTLAITETNEPFKWINLLFVLLCMVFARNAAMGFNRWADANIDKLNPRTAIREIPSGAIQPKSALFFVLINCILFLATTYFINPLCFALAPIVLAIILGYSYTKRFTALCHIILGLGLAIAPIGAFLAVSPTFYLPVFILAGVVLTWVSGFDIIYSLQDEEFDQEHELHSIPSLVGKQNALNISKALHLISAILVIYLGMSLSPISWLYWIGAAGFIGLLIFQHSLVTPTNLSKVNLAFFTTNGVASVLFAVFVITALVL